jgi:hypothetical protein
MDNEIKEVEVLDKYCTYVYEDTGMRCNAYRQKNSLFCFTHDPLQKEAHMRAVSEGGKSRGFLCKLKPVKIENIDDVVAFVGICVNEVRRGALEPRLANSFFYGAGVLIRALEVKRDIEKKTDINNSEEERVLNIIRLYGKRLNNNNQEEHKKIEES